MPTDAKEQLILEIRCAFEGVVLGGGVSLHEACAIDDYASAQERENARALDTEAGWRDVADEYIEKYYDVFPFFDLQGFRYYLPAYMIWSVKNLDLSDSCSIDRVIYNLIPSSVSPERSRQIFASFNDAQCSAIYHFLIFMQAQPSYVDVDAAAEALDAYWNRFCP